MERVGGLIVRNFLMSNLASAPNHIRALELTSSSCCQLILRRMSHGIVSNVNSVQGSKLDHQRNSYRFEKQIHTTVTNRMFIQVEETPNPNSLKFYPGEPILESGTIDFQDKVTASLKSPLAKSLFRIKGVKSVFFSQEFITVTKDDDDALEWKVLKPQIFSAIMIFYTMKQPVLFDEPELDANAINEDDSEIVKEIKQLIEDRIRPTIQEDGGDLAFVAYEDGIVKLRLQGACTSCPSSIVTLRSGIKNMLQFYIPEIVDVEQIS